MAGTSNIGGSNYTGRGGDTGSAKDAKNGSALNDVKSRLAAMQRNKEELEEKLKTYEAKIKQHYNK